MCIEYISTQGPNMSFNKLTEWYLAPEVVVWVFYVKHLAQSLEQNTSFRKR